MQKTIHNIKVYLNDELVQKNLGNTSFKVLFAITYILIAGYLNQILNNGVSSYDFALLSGTTFVLIAVFMKNISPRIQAISAVTIYLVLLPASYVIFHSVYPSISNITVHVQDLIWGTLFILVGVILAWVLNTNKRLWLN